MQTPGRCQLPSVVGGVFLTEAAGEECQRKRAALGEASSPGHGVIPVGKWRSNWVKLLVIAHTAEQQWAEDRPVDPLIRRRAAKDVDVPPPGVLPYDELDRRNRGRAAGVTQPARAPKPPVMVAYNHSSISFATDEVGRPR